jgi:hypothetical protein
LNILNDFNLRKQFCAISVVNSFKVNAEEQIFEE